MVLTTKMMVNGSITEVNMFGSGLGLGVLLGIPIYASSQGYC